ncbi:MAG: UDP-3-O-acyl-N-acetylglucosamine deacetylase [Rhodospirillales bacterium]|nr:UDP-3-O-acyl-N-acetylglucosamine deacetylase [Rhodospirillales bacterium]MCW8951393.1 UDP-3-O-acyl-N-acetylglucosamine deacetylase [Rhodospirillales bacterium]MCW8970432.1 UDP-3-O-acyl-N-acetylglucosamine deacetylase [Rhodospirillales bacterium]
MRQKTLKTSISCTGISLHSGEKVSMNLCPAGIDHGIKFKRTDIAGGGSIIPARWDHVVDTRLNTTLGNDDGVTVSTVEHLMSALAGSNIDNALIEINGPEVPIMDGSAAPFMFLVECAGVVEQRSERRAIRIEKPIRVTDGDIFAEFIPDDGFVIDFAIDYSGTVIDRQEVSVPMAAGAFNNDVARARTFGFLSEVEQLRAAGLARGGSLDNAIVISGDEVMNEDGLRYDDEFVRHKVLDAVGDLYLAGAPIVGRFRGECSGHTLNNRLLRAMFADTEAWSVVPAKDLDISYATMPVAAEKVAMAATA